MPKAIYPMFERFPTSFLCETSDGIIVTQHSDGVMGEHTAGWTNVRSESDRGVPRASFDQIMNAWIDAHGALGLGRPSEAEIARAAAFLRQTCCMGVLWVFRPAEAVASAA